MCRRLPAGGGSDAAGCFTTTDQARFKTEMGRLPAEFRQKETPGALRPEKFAVATLPAGRRRHFAGGFGGHSGIFIASGPGGRRDLATA